MSSAPLKPRRPLIRRAIDRVIRMVRWPFLPLRNKLRDRQAPRLHHYMMHEASVPMELSARPALIVAPHADDETFGCGGVIALKTNLSAIVHVLIVTDGRSSHTHVAGTDVPSLIRTRKEEVIAACGILGVPAANVHFLDLPDQGLYRLTHERWCAASSQVADLLRTLRPQEMYINHPRDPHPDHEATYLIVERGMQEAGIQLDVYQYPVWLLWKGRLRLSARPRDLRGAKRLDVRAVQDRKNRAIDVYRSQLPVLPPGFVDQFTQGYEVFFQGVRPHGQS